MMGLYDCAAAFAAPRSTRPAVKTAMIHFFSCLIPFALQSLEARREQAQVKGPDPLGLAAQGSSLLVGHHSKHNFDNYAGRTPPMRHLSFGQFCSLVSLYSLRLSDAHDTPRVILGP